MIERYGVYRVNLDPVIGSEIGKSRPALVVSDDEMNARLKTVVVCPLTSRIHDRWPSRVQTHVAGRPGEIAVDKIRTVSRDRLMERIGQIDATAAETVRHVITQMYGVLSVASREARTSASRS